MSVEEKKSSERIKIEGLFSFDTLLKKIDEVYLSCIIILYKDFTFISIYLFIFELVHSSKKQLSFFYLVFCEN